ncbi:MAG: ABC transporter substrate-binding protein [Thermoleophilaceae bacterium]
MVTYRLNPKARWSNGRQIDWTDYEAQWKALRGTDEAYQVASNSGYERVGSVRRGRDDLEVVVTYAQPFGEWQSVFAGLYPKEVNGDPERFNTDYLNKIPITAGPFKLEEIDETAQTVTVVRDPKWWGPPAKLDRIVYRALAPDAAINAFVSGEIDLVDVGPNPSNYKRVQGVRERGRALGGRTRLPPLHDERDQPGAERRERPPRDRAGRQPRRDHPGGPRGPRLAHPDDGQPLLREHPGGLPRQRRRRRARSIPRVRGRLLDRAGWRPGPGGVRAKGAAGSRCGS